MFCLADGAMAIARSLTRVAGILGTKISPPWVSSMHDSTKATPWSSEIQKRVMRGSVIGNSLAPCASRRLKKGTTEPREPTTLP